MWVFYGQVSQNDNSSVKRRGFTDESRYRDFHTLWFYAFVCVPRARSSCAGFIRNFFTDILKNHYICNGNQT